MVWTQEALCVVIPMSLDLVGARVPVEAGLNSTKGFFGYTYPCEHFGTVHGIPTPFYSGVAVVVAVPLLRFLTSRWLRRRFRFNFVGFFRKGVTLITFDVFQGPDGAGLFDIPLECTDERLAPLWVRWVGLQDGEVGERVKMGSEGNKRVQRGPRLTMSVLRTRDCPLPTIVVSTQAT